VYSMTINKSYHTGSASAVALAARWRRRKTMVGLRAQEVLGVLKRAAIERLDSHGRRLFNRISSGAPAALVGQEGIRCGPTGIRRANSGAAPATVSGELVSRMPLRFAVQGAGRRRRAKTREPGDLPERRHPSTVRGARLGRASAAVDTDWSRGWRPPVLYLDVSDSSLTSDGARPRLSAVKIRRTDAMGMPIASPGVPAVRETLSLDASMLGRDMRRIGIGISKKESCCRARDDRSTKANWETLRGGRGANWRTSRHRGIGSMP